MGREQSQSCGIQKNGDQGMTTGACEGMSRRTEKHPSPRDTEASEPTLLAEKHTPEGGEQSSRPLRKPRAQPTAVEKRAPWQVSGEAIPARQRTRESRRKRSRSGRARRRGPHGQRREQGGRAELTHHTWHECAGSCTVSQQPSESQVRN